MIYMFTITKDYSNSKICIYLCVKEIASFNFKNQRGKIKIQNKNSEQEFRTIKNQNQKTKYKSEFWSTKN